MRFTQIAIAILLATLLTKSPLLADDAPSMLDIFRKAISGAIESMKEAAPAEQPKSEVIWHETIDDAVTHARENGKPIFVVVGAPWCGYCEKLQAELEGEPEQSISGQWVLAKIDADKQVGDARELHANALPALRLLSSDGIVTARRDGYAPVGQLQRWLEENYAMTKAQMPTLLTKDIEQLEEAEIETLISLMAIRDITARRVVLNRLSEMPAHAVHPTIGLLADGNLAHQLSALQLLRGWGAPIDGLDPWEPDSVTEDSIDRLKAWGTTEYPPSQDPPAESPPEDSPPEDSPPEDSPPAESPPEDSVPAEDRDPLGKDV